MIRRILSNPMLVMLACALWPADARAQLEWRVSVKFFTDANGNIPGSDSCCTNVNTYEAISNRIAEANAVLDRTGRGYRFRLVEIVNIPGTTAPLPSSTNSWYNVLIGPSSQDDLDSKAKQNSTTKAAFAFREDAINFYITGSSGGAGGGVCAFPNENQDVILVAQDSRTMVLVHEAGHYFSLLHTHNTEMILDGMGSPCTNANPCTCVQFLGGDDGIADTPVDNECWTQNQIATNTYGQLYSVLNSAQQYFVDNTWLNIMSYHRPRDRLTDDQMDVMTDVSNDSNQRFKVASGRTRFVNSNNSGSQNGSSTEPYRTVMSGLGAADAGDIILIRSGNYNEPQTITNRITLRATRGAATIGRP